MVSALKKFNKFCALIGLTPYSMKVRQQKFQKAYIWLLLLAHYALVMHCFVFKPTDKTVFVANLSAVTLFIKQTITFTINMLESILTFQQYYRFLQKSNRIKILLQRELSAQFDWREEHRKFKLKIIFYTIINYSCISVGVFVITVEYYNGFFGYALLLVLIMRFRCLQFIIYVECIAIYLKTLNQRLRALVSSKHKMECFFLDVDYKRLESLQFLKAAKNVYNEIYEFSAMFCNIYGWSLMTLCFTIFTDILINAYWTILAWEQIYLFNYVYLTTSSMLALSVIIGMFCYSCEKCEKECSITRKYVQRLITAPDHRDLNASIYIDLVKEFLIQIMQHPIEIEAKGFLVVNMQLLMGFFAAMSTYLIILSQFRDNGQHD